MKREMNMVQIKIDKTKYSNEIHSTSWKGIKVGNYRNVEFLFVRVLYKAFLHYLIGLKKPISLSFLLPVVDRLGILQRDYMEINSISTCAREEGWGILGPRRDLIKT